MKAILLSIRPEWVEKILNGNKTIEIRKMFPKDYVGWVYIYCTKGKSFLYYAFCRDVNFETTIGECEENYFLSKVEHKEENEKNYIVRNLNGKVVARFWCNKVEEIKVDFSISKNGYYGTHLLGEPVLEKTSCLTHKDLKGYLRGDEKCNDVQNIGCAIHISDLEIFDKPKELSEFNRNIRFSNNALISSNVKQ